MKSLCIVKYVTLSDYFLIIRKACEKLAKANKITDANIYVCLGGKPTGRPGGGVASLATVCDSDRSTRAAYIQYVTMSGDTQKAVPAAQQAKYTGAVR